MHPCTWYFQPFFNFCIFLFFLVHFIFNNYFNFIFHLHKPIIYDNVSFKYPALFVHVSKVYSLRFICRTGCHQVMLRDRSDTSACTLIGLMTMEFTLYVMRKTWLENHVRVTQNYLVEVHYEYYFAFLRKAAP